MGSLIFKNRKYDRHIKTSFLKIENMIATH